jgi:hypothetical protein
MNTQIIISGAQAIYSDATKIIVRTGNKYIALIKSIMEDGTEYFSFMPLNQISNLVAVEIKNDE